MGKGNRNKQNRAQERVDNPDKYLEQRRAQKKAQKTKGGLGITIACIVLAVIIVSAIVLSALSSQGVFLRMTDAIYTENFEVDSAMMNFFFNDYLMNWYQQYSAYLQLGYISVNFTQNLKNQTYGSGSEAYLFGSFEGSWYDFFLQNVASEVTMYLEYAEGAKDAGITLTQEDYDEIDDIIDNLNTSLKQSNAKYSTWYGSGVKESDVRKCYEIVYLASRFNDVKRDEFEKLLEENDDPVKQYPEDNKGSFYSAEYLSYTITESSADYENDEAFNNAVERAKENAEKLAAATSAEEFFELIQVYIEENEEETTSSDEDDTDEDDTTKEPSMDDYKHNISYGTSSELEQWIFEDGAKENDANVFDEKTTEEVTEKVTKEGSTETTVEEKVVTEYEVTAYFITNPSSLDYDLTKDLGYIITSDKNLAQSILDTFKSGDMSADALNDLGLAEYEKLGENSTTTLYHSSAEKVQPGYFGNYSYDEIDEWLDNEDLEEGTCSDIITIEPSSSSGTTYYAICYFEKYNKEVWYVNAYEGVITDMFDEWYQGEDGNGGQIAKTPVTLNQSALRKLHVIAMGTVS